MKKSNTNKFIDKFRFLNSQESSEEISWSWSDSSEYEYDDNKHCGETVNKHISRKRKRGRNRKKELKNVSNLDFTTVNTGSDRKISTINSKSPILVGKCKSVPTQKSSIAKDHILRSSEKKYTVKSPIIVYNSKLIKNSPKVKKKLFVDNICVNSKTKPFEGTRSISPIFNIRKDVINKNKCMYNENNGHINDMHIKNHTTLLHDCKINENSTEYKQYSEDEEINIESTQCSSSEESVSKKSQSELVRKTKSYFDNCFTSETSQTISECETPTPRNSSKSSCEIDIATPRTQERDVTYLSKDILSTNSYETHMSVKKKVKYKKGGLAYRLNELVKKQTASITLWHHERFLAANSNFVIPKQESSAFRIKNVNFKFGIYLLEIVNKDGNFFTAIINNLYVNKTLLEIDSVLKIYEPFKIVDANDGTKLICNICKFECDKLII